MERSHEAPGTPRQASRLVYKTHVKESISDAVVAKDEDIFLLSHPSGDVPLDGEHGLGLYYHDCRYLNGYELTLDDVAPTALEADASRGFALLFALTNPRIALPDGEWLDAQSLGITRERVLDHAELAVHEILSIHNHAPRPIDLHVKLAFRAEFEDIFIVRGLKAEPAAERGRVTPEVGTTALSFAREGRDGVVRTLEVQLCPIPHPLQEGSATWQLHLEAEEAKEILVSMRISESTSGSGNRPGQRAARLGEIVADLDRSTEAWMGDHTRVRSGSKLLDSVVHRSLLDLRVLRSRWEELQFFSGGIPWYATLFGRDSLIAALDTLAFEPGMSAQTLRLLARDQGQKIDEARDEEPGKILHELRVGELARLGEIPFTPYYGTVDATLLFLILLERHAAWTGRLELFRELEGNVERALAWTEGNLDRSFGGYVTYEKKSPRGLDNQGWKDSGDAIVNEDGSLARPPIALAEVQGYAYFAFRAASRLYARAGRAEESLRLQQRASALKERYNRDFWLEDKGIYALALQAGGEPVAVVASNAGQALWSGIADADKAARTADRLMQEDMFSGWGVRTLSAKEHRYNPIGYHLGTVWPHDSAIVAAGLRRYGHDAAALRIFAGILEMAGHLPNHRLPELITGFSRDQFSRPVRYPLACHPQAWAAGSVPFLLQTLLGLVPDAFAGQLRIVRPCLPDFVPHLVLEGLRVGSARASLRVDRRSDGSLAVETLHLDGELEITVEPRGSE
ncbi:MAG: glycogen debranching N-terminal domain-containing protein [Byssovorax sp.]